MSSEDPSGEAGRVTLAGALARLPGPGGERFAKVFEHGSLVVEIFAPRGRDTQQPHARNEIYVVITGSGEFLSGGARQPFTPGDVLFVPAGLPHRFENFTPDLTVWVFFYGPEGGEGQKAEGRKQKAVQSPPTYVAGLELKRS